MDEPPYLAKPRPRYKLIKAIAELVETINIYQTNLNKSNMSSNIMWTNNLNKQNWDDLSVNWLILSDQQALGSCWNFRCCFNTNRHNSQLLQPQKRHASGFLFAGGEGCGRRGGSVLGSGASEQGDQRRERRGAWVRCIASLIDDVSRIVH